MYVGGSTASQRNKLRGVVTGRVTPFLNLATPNSGMAKARYLNFNTA